MAFVTSYDAICRKPVLGGHPVLSGHYCIPRGCPLNTGFTVLEKGNNFAHVREYIDMPVSIKVEEVRSR